MPDSTRSEVQPGDVARVWWVFLSLGLLSVIAGVVVLAKPGNSLKALAVVTGIFVLIDGIAELLMSLSQRTPNRGFVALIGMLDLIVGILLIRHPVGGVTAVALLLAIWLMALGVVRFVRAFESDEHRLWQLIVAAVEVIAGIAIVADPNIGYATLALFVGFAFILYGGSLILLGWAAHATKDAVARSGRSASAAT